MIPYDELMQVTSPPTEVAWSDRDTMLYALAVGCGRGDAGPDLRFVYEQDLVALPTFATVLAAHGIPTMVQMGANPLMMLHGEQAVEWRRPLPPAGRGIIEGRVVEAVDKGAKGAIVVSETTLTDAGGELLAVLRATRFCRADGGFGGPTQRREVPPEPPSRAPDRVIELETRPEQALLYRLCGDRNPVHADPAVAQAAGFANVILHGLCTFGMGCRGILRAFGDQDPARLVGHQARFSSPVYPGETLVLRLWRDEPVVWFEMEARDRDVTVLKNGRAVLG